MEGIILAGGLGTRLRPRVQDVPKPIAPIAGRPFLCWLLDRLAQQDFHRIVLSVGYGKTKIIEALGSRYGNIELVYAVEDVPLGTGGAIRHALSSPAALRRLAAACPTRPRAARRPRAPRD